MAKGKKKGKKKNRGTPNSGAVGLEDADGVGIEAEEGDVADDARALRSVSSKPAVGGPKADRSTRIGGLSIYKPGQGYYTRIGTVIGAAILIAGMWNYLYGVLGVYYDPDKPWTFYLQMGIPTLVAVGLGFLVYWLVGRKRSTCDFMILTEGEMKKVSWSSRKEVIGSTKVVIFVVIAMALYLFIANYVFSFLFHWLGVLEVAPGAFGRAAGG